MRKVLFILSELADSDLDWMLRNGLKQAYPPGAVLIEEGKPLEVIFVLLDGQLSVSVGGAQGKEVAKLQAGEVLGELSFLDSRPPSATVKALDEVSVLAIPRPRLEEKLAEDDSFAARFYRALGVFLAARLRRTLRSMGYEKETRIFDEDVDHEDELDPEVLQRVALAGARFDWMLKTLRGARSSGSTGER
jgi:bacteriocin-type transport-associated protein